MVAPEVYEMLLIKTEILVNPFESTIKQTQENLNTVWNRVAIFEWEEIRLHREELNKLRREKDERNATAYPLQKSSIDKMKKERMSFKTTLHKAYL